MSELAAEAAGKFLHEYEVGNKEIKSSPETFLQYSIPYLTVRTLQRLEQILNRQEEALARQEKAFKGLEADSGWIKWFAIITGIFTIVLVILTVIISRFALQDLFR